MPSINLASQARPAVDKLVSQDEDQLYTRLGRLLTMNAEDPRKGVVFEPEEPEIETYGIADTAKQFGKKYFDLVNRQAYQLVCGSDAQNASEREQVAKAFALGSSDVAAAIAAMLVAQLAVAPAVAAVIAALTVKLFFKPAHKAMCAVWKEKMPDAKQ